MSWCFQNRSSTVLSLERGPITPLPHFGGFTFDKQSSSKRLIIPNLIAAKRFGTAILRRFKLLGSMQRAIKFLTSEGDIKKVLSSYRMSMVECDTGASGFGKNEEEDYRDRFYVVTLADPALILIRSTR